MPEEIFDVVDADDRVIGRAPRSEVHARRLLHRAVNIFGFDDAGRLLLQLRSPGKDQFPSCYTSSASGHLAAGEDYETAGVRELQEELGVQASLQYFGKLPASPQTAYEHSALYVTRLNPDELRPDPAEITRIEFLDPATIADMIAQSPERFAPPFVELFHWYQASSNPNQGSGDR